MTTLKKTTLMLALLGAGAMGFQTPPQAMEPDRMPEPSAATGVEAGEHAEADGAARGQGVIHVIDAVGRSINITHGPIPDLNWPGMTMDLPVGEQVDLSGLSPGDRVDFEIVLGSDDVYRITALSASE